MSDYRNPLAVIALDEDEERGHLVVRCVRCGVPLTRWVQHIGDGRVPIEAIARDHLAICQSPAGGDARRDRRIK